MRPLAWTALALLTFASAAPRAQAQPPLGERMRDAFERLDANGDRVLERSEIPDDGLAAFDRLLKRGDANADGKLDGEELRALGEKVRKLGGPAAGGPAGARLKAMDANGDGKVNREEFQGPKPLFDRLDRDGDGALSGDELKPGAAARPGAAQAKPRPGSAAKPGANNGPAAARLKAMDADGDGKVSREEFQGRPQLFDRLDTNKDGVLDRSDRPAGSARAARPVKAKKGRAGARRRAR